MNLPKINKKTEEVTFFDNISTLTYRKWTIKRGKKSRFPDIDISVSTYRKRKTKRKYFKFSRYQQYCYSHLLILQFPSIIFTDTPRQATYSNRIPWNVFVINLSHIPQHSAVLFPSIPCCFDFLSFRVTAVFPFRRMKDLV